MIQRESWQEMAMREHQGHEGTVIAGKGELDVIRCAPCGFAHVVPLPSDEDGRRLTPQYQEPPGVTPVNATNATALSWPRRGL